MLAHITGTTVDQVGTPPATAHTGLAVPTAAFMATLL